MKSTNFSVNDSRRTDDFSKPYECRQGKVIEVPFRVIDAVGPAGSLNSSGDDMLKWLLANLNAGHAGDRQVISGDTIAHMHRVQMAFSEDVRFPESKLRQQTNNTNSYLPFNVYTMSWHQSVYHVLIAPAPQHPPRPSPIPQFSLSPFRLPPFGPCPSSSAL